MEIYWKPRQKNVRALSVAAPLLNSGLNTLATTRGSEQTINHVATIQYHSPSCLYHYTPNMPRKVTSRAGTPAVATETTTVSSSTTASSTNIRQTNDLSQIVTHIWNSYQQKTPQRTKLIDSFMAFLVVVGALQFVYCVLGGNYVRYPSYHEKRFGALVH